jgi:transposase
VKEQVTTAPADVEHGDRRVRVVWVKRRWVCEVAECPVRTFTESLPQVPRRCRLTVRLREHCAALVAEDGMAVQQAARRTGTSWPTVHDAFAARVDPVLETPLGLVEHLGIDEHRRGRHRWATDSGSGEYVVLADRWHTCFFDLSGDQGLLGQVEGRSSDDAAYWLASQSPAWRHHVKVAVIDMCTIYASAVRRMLPHAVLAVDPFHIVQLATKIVGDVRRRAVREKYGRRGKTGDTEYGLKNLLVKNLEHLRPEQQTKIIEVLEQDRHGQQILAAWIAKEKLRALIALRATFTRSTPAASQVRHALAEFFSWCADHDDIPEIATIARTVDRWAPAITAAILLGDSNARSKGLNRVAKLEATNAYGFRNPAHQRRRVRTACTRSNRRSSPTATKRRPQTVIIREQDPG